jgi:hypothetical protein
LAGRFTRRKIRARRRRKFWNPRRERGKAFPDFFNPLAGLGDAVHAHVVIDGGFLRQTSAAQIADDFADDSCASHLETKPALSTLISPTTFAVESSSSFSVERLQVRALRDNHFVPFFARLAGVANSFRQVFARSTMIWIFWFGPADARRNR